MASATSPIQKATAAEQFPCSICNSAFGNPRELGNHILESHCEDKKQCGGAAVKTEKEEVADTGAQAKTGTLKLAAWSTVTSEATPIPDALKAIQVPVINSATSANRVNNNIGGTTIKRLPGNRLTTGSTAPTGTTGLTEDKRQKFLAHRVSDSSTRYTCMLCGKVYASRYNIRMHMNMHSGRNVHTCSFCGRFFAHKHVFESHVRTHTGERPYSCCHCGKTFGDRSNRTSHQKKCRRAAGDVLVRSNNMVTEKGKKNDNRAKDKTEVDNLAHGQVYNDNVEDDDVDEDHEDPFHPQIVSVESIQTQRGQDESPEENEGDDEVTDDDDDDDDDEETIVVPSAISDLDVDDIIDDSLYDEDLEEIQIEPDIVDYDGEESDSSGGFPQVSLPQVPIPLHQLQHDKIIPDFMCSFCNDRFSEQASLIAHLSAKHITLPKQHTANRKAPDPVKKVNGPNFVCLKCGKSFRNEVDLKGHLSSHADKQKYSCSVCGKSFSTTSELNAHSNTHGDRKFNCEHCNLAFVEKVSMLEHQNICPMNLEQRRKADPKRSAASIGTTVIVPPTRMTTRSASRRGSDRGIEDGIRLVSPPPGVVEPIPVRKRSSTTGSYFPSEDHYVPDNNSSNVINKDDINPPPTAAERKQGFCFRKIHTGQQRIICVLCGKHYTTMYNMRQHRNIHTGRGLHRCQYCGKQFTHKHVWETHERIHTGERPFRCQHCSKDFADRSNYNSHRKLCATIRR